MVNGISDKSQAIITFIALSLIGLGTVSIPTGVLPLWVGVVFILAGVIGAALKEAFGTKSPARLN